MTTATRKRPARWPPRDWNALFGFGTHIPANMLTLTAPLRYVPMIGGFIAPPHSPAAGEHAHGSGSLGAAT